MDYFKTILKLPMTTDIQKNFNQKEFESKTIERMRFLRSVPFDNIIIFVDFQFS